MSQPRCHPALDLSPGAAVTQAHKPGGLKQQKLSLSDLESASLGHHAAIDVGGATSLQGLGKSIPAAARVWVLMGILWLVAASLQSLPPRPVAFSVSLCEISSCLP